MKSNHKPRRARDADRDVRSSRSSAAPGGCRKGSSQKGLADHTRAEHILLDWAKIVGHGCSLVVWLVLIGVCTHEGLLGQALFGRSLVSIGGLAGELLTRR
jgi:hypothetical protein